MGLMHIPEGWRYITKESGVPYVMTTLVVLRLLSYANLLDLGWFDAHSNLLLVFVLDRQTSK